MPYAANGQISQSPIEGGVQITEAQYSEALNGMQKGYAVTVDEGFKVGPVPEPEPPEPAPELTEEEKLKRWREIISVSAFQAHQALDDFELYDQVEAIMASPDTPSKTRRAWRMATEFRRLSPTVLELAGVLGLNDEQLDELFSHALTIEA